MKTSEQWWFPRTAKLTITKANTIIFCLWNKIKVKPMNFPEILNYVLEKLIHVWSTIWCFDTYIYCEIIDAAELSCHWMKVCSSHAGKKITCTEQFSRERKAQVVCQFFRKGQYTRNGTIPPLPFFLIGPSFVIQVFSWNMLNTHALSQKWRSLSGMYDNLKEAWQSLTKTYLEEVFFNK